MFFNMEPCKHRVDFSWQIRSPPCIFPLSPLTPAGRQPWFFLKVFDKTGSSKNLSGIKWPIFWNQDKICRRCRSNFKHFFFKSDLHLCKIRPDVASRLVTKQNSILDILTDIHETFNWSYFPVMASGHCLSSKQWSIMNLNSLLLPQFGHWLKRRHTIDWRSWSAAAEQQLQAASLYFTTATKR